MQTYSLPTEDSEEAEIAKLICEHTGVRINIGTKEYYELQDFAKAVLEMERKRLLSEFDGE